MDKPVYIEARDAFMTLSVYSGSSVLSIMYSCKDAAAQSGISLSDSCQGFTTKHHNDTVDSEFLLTIRCLKNP